MLLIVLSILISLVSGAYNTCPGCASFSGCAKECTCWDIGEDNLSYQNCKAAVADLDGDYCTNWYLKYKLCYYCEDCEV